MSILVFN